VKFFALFAAALLVAVALAACGSGEESSNTAEKVSAAEKMSAAEIAKLPDFRIPARQGPVPRKLVVRDVREGSGAVMKAGDAMFVEWAETGYGKALKTPTPEGQPQEFPFDGVLEGWELGMPGMKVGGRRELVVPPRLGDTGTTMVYQIDLLAIGRSAEESGALQVKTGSASAGGEADGADKTTAKAAPPQRPGPQTRMSKAEIAKLPKLTIAKQSGPPPRHIEIVDLRKGSGATVTKQNYVEVHWLQVSYPEALERSHSGLHGPQRFGLDETVAGWTVGLPGMKVGGRRELILPPKLVYPRWKPSWGYEPYVDIYVIDLLGTGPRS